MGMVKKKRESDAFYRAHEALMKRKMMEAAKKRDFAGVERVAMAYGLFLEVNPGALKATTALSDAPQEQQ